MNRASKIKVFDIESLPRDLLDRRWPKSKWYDPELERHVRAIMNEVRERGDSALIKFAKEFDNVELSADALRVGSEEIEPAYSEVKEEQVSALRFLKSRIEYFEKERLERISFDSERAGVKVYFRTRPLQSVGCYVPGAEAAYPSTLLMMAAPARLAGVKRLVVCSPPTKGGTLNSLTLVAADLCGIDELYKVGGAQAIAALAYGTDSIRPVEKIVGPGNKYVTMAKILVSQDVATDLPAGPSEIIILADENADARLIALDLISQAEHWVDSISILVTTSEEISERVVEDIDKILPTSPRKEIVGKALSDNGAVIRCQNLGEAVDFANSFAPEHLEIVTKDPMAVADRIKSAGLILIGPYTPVSASDYAFGTNHILPTYGFGHAFSGLSVLDFVRRVSIIESTKDGLSRMRGHIGALAEAEGLFSHASAVEGRFEN
ncbi:MAG: histidinol dehydrogenase [Candidatus Bathyarchaeota archaeon]|nr:histidinol dehydrogenase [Candidatus Bathyarchaeota archaeon]